MRLSCKMLLFDNLFLLADILESSKSMNILERLYSLLSARFKLISFISLKTLITCALLTWVSCWCQSYIYLFWLLKWESWSLLLIAIALAGMIWLSAAKSNIKKFCSFLAYAIILLFYVNIIAIRLSW